MVKITSHSCDYQKDQKRLVDFWLDVRAASDVRRYPTIWRFRLLLTSRVWEPAKDSRIWENATGQIIGFAMLWRRQPTSSTIVLDSFTHPLFANESLLLEILRWGNQRAHELAAGQKNLPNPDEQNIYFAKSLRTEIPNPALPPGYTIRHLRKMDDLESYQSLYGFAKVNPLHQKELHESDEYCHFVVVNPGGEFAAY